MPVGGSRRLKLTLNMLAHCGCRRGQSLVVWAIREGRDAASAVDKYLVSKFGKASGALLPNKVAGGIVDVTEYGRDAGRTRSPGRGAVAV